MLVGRAMKSACPRLTHAPTDKSKGLESRKEGGLFDGVCQSVRAQHARAKQQSAPLRRGWLSTGERRSLPHCADWGASREVWGRHAGSSLSWRVVRGGGKQKCAALNWRSWAPGWIDGLWAMRGHAGIRTFNWEKRVVLIWGEMHLFRSHYYQVFPNRFRVETPTIRGISWVSCLAFTPKKIPYKIKVCVTTSSTIPNKLFLLKENLKCNNIISCISLFSTQNINY